MKNNEKFLRDNVINIRRRSFGEMILVLNPLEPEYCWTFLRITHYQRSIYTAFV